MNYLPTCIALGFLASWTNLSAQTYTEISDAGQTLPTADVVSANVTQIQGNIADITNDVDLYRIVLPSVATFVAEVSIFDIEIAPQFSSYEPDSILFLFDSTGAPVAVNDDRSIPPDPVDLLSTISTGPLAAGTYYLAIASWDARAVDAENDQWWLQDEPIPADFGTLENFTSENVFIFVDGEEPPYPSGDYTITLNTATVPEPATSAMMLIAGCGLLALRRRRA